MRSHYKLASHNVHAGVKGITFEHGSLNDPRRLVAGASNAGLHEPGQNTAITLAQITMLLLVERPQLDESVAMRILMTLQDETVKSFIKVSRQLSREEREQREGKGRPKSGKEADCSASKPAKRPNSLARRGYRSHRLVDLSKKWDAPFGASPERLPSGGGSGPSEGQLRATPSRSHRRCE
ncbi:hypothetical protein [Caulobacter sp. S45]|uniref:hypothetical protein n=1 Tax=Caulobacter sp. S45 TaxID=1641861 RepID=UPI00131DA417|nr:hypothetical protein [Caulobacter sp. S45]